MTELGIVELVMYTRRVKVDMVEYFMEELLLTALPLQSELWFSAISATFAFVQK